MQRRQYQYLKCVKAHRFLCQPSHYKNTANNLKDELVMQGSQKGMDLVNGSVMQKQYHCNTEKKKPFEKQSVKTWKRVSNTILQNALISATTSFKHLMIHYTYVALANECCNLTAMNTKSMDITGKIL